MKYILSLFIALSAVAAQAQRQFTVTDLGLGISRGGIQGINNRGEVIGSSATYDTGSIYRIGGNTVVGGYPILINNNGEVISTDRYSYLLYQKGKNNKRFPNITGGIIALNDRDLILAGYNQGIFNTNDQLVFQVSLDGFFNGFNDKDQLVGDRTINNGKISTTFQAVLYSNGRLQDLGVAGKNNTSAMAINDQGQIIGSIQFPYATVDTAKYLLVHTFLWQNGVIRDLTPASLYSSFPVAINNSGEVVLQLAGSYKLYVAGLPLVDISASLLSSSNNQWVADNETNVPAINDLGQIAVTAQLNGAGADHVILMSVRR
jgi:probable HAF family extracellular repeat protein